MAWYDIAVNKLKEIGNNLESLIQSSEQRYASAMIEALALVTFADGKVDDKEVEAASSYLANVPHISETFKSGDAMNLFHKALVELKNAGAANTPLMLERIAANCTDEVKKQSLLGACISLAKADHIMHPLEQEMIDRIADKLNAEVDWDKYR